MDHDRSLPWPMADLNEFDIAETSLSSHVIATSRGAPASLPMPRLISKLTRPKTVLISMSVVTQVGYAAALQSLVSAGARSPGAS